MDHAIMCNMSRALSETGRAVGLLIHSLGIKGEPFVNATIVTNLDSISPQNASNRLKHFKDLGYVTKSLDGLYRVPQDKLEPLWDYLTVGSPKKKNTMELNIVDLPNTFTVIIDTKTVPLHSLLAVAATESDEQYENVLAKKLFQYINILYTMGVRAKDFPVDDTNQLEYKRAKAMLEEWMQ